MFDNRIAIQNDTGCHIWLGGRNLKGYGRSVYYKGKSYLAHRLAYMLAVSEIPEGKKVLHKCDNPPCINIEHLYLGTDKDNARDRDSKGRGYGGERHHSTKLTIEDVLDMRIVFGLGAKVSDIAKAFNVSHPNAWEVVHYKIWRNIYV